jgi:hypothetical protein
MKKSLYSEEQIIGILKQHEAGVRKKGAGQLVISKMEKECLAWGVPGHCWHAYPC